MDVTLTAFLCETCGTQYAPARAAPLACPVCADDRQYVPAHGQRWTTLAELRRRHRNAWSEPEPGLAAFRTEAPFAIHHQAYVVDGGGAQVLWEPNALADEETAAAILRRGPVAAIAVSHPHFYTSMVEWSELLGGAPIYLHAADASWIRRPSAAIRLWEGTSPELPGGMQLLHTGGHFPGSQCLLWPGGAGGAGALFVGDDPSVCADRQHLAFMHSFPNHVPLGPAAAERVAAALAPHRFDRIYGWRPGLVIETGGQAALARSLARHLEALGALGGPARPRAA